MVKGCDYWKLRTLEVLLTIPNCTHNWGVIQTKENVSYLLICFKIGTGVGFGADDAGPEYPGCILGGAGLSAGPGLGLGLGASS